MFEFLKKSTWTFPLVLLILLSFLTFFKVHGSSIGIYHSDLYGSSQPDEDLLFGKPRSIRSDEYLSRTPAISYQSKNNFPSLTNNDISPTRKSFKQTSTPAMQWTTFFTPQNWAYFILPFENAYAFSWWAILVFFIIAAYFFILEILPKRKLLAVLLSLSFALSPFFFWWYSSSANVFMVFGFGFLILTLAHRIINNKNIPHIKSKLISDFIYALILGWIGVAYGLLIYVPFLLPVFLVLSVFLIGFIIEKKPPRSELLRYARIILLSLLFIFAIAFIFYTQNSKAIDSYSNTEYPGVRSLKSGGQNVLAVLDGPFMAALQSNPRAMHYYTNQSEASNFILLLPFLMLPAFTLLYLRRKKIGLTGWALLLTQIIAIFFLLRLFVPFGDPFYEFFLLDKVPHNRLLAGLGFAGFLQLILIIKLLDEVRLSKKFVAWFASFFAFFTFLSVVLIGVFIKQKYPGFIDETGIVIALALFTGIIIYSFLSKRFFIGAVLLLALSFISIYKINPVYKEVDIFERSDVANKIRELSSEDSHWITVDTLQYESLPYGAGRNMISGQQSGANTDFWKNKNDDPKYEYIYNRQAHAIFLSNTLKNVPSNKANYFHVKDDFGYVKGNVFKVKFECDEFTYKYIDFVLAVKETDFPCLKQIEKSVYPNVTFYIYKVSEE